MTGQSDKGRPEALSFGALLSSAARALAAYHLVFIAAVAAPLAFDVIGYTVLKRWHGGERPVLLSLAMDGAFLALYMMFLVALNRAILVGPDSVRRPFHFSFGRREGLAFAYALVLVGALSLVVVIAIPILSAFPGIQDTLNRTLGAAGALPASALFNLVCVLVSVRFTFIFPAISCDGEVGWGSSWRQTRGIAWTLAAILFTVLMTVTVIKAGEARLETFYGALGPVGPGVVSLLFDVCYYYLEAIAILAVAIAYRQRVLLTVEEGSS